MTSNSPAPAELVTEERVLPADPDAASPELTAVAQRLRGNTLWHVNSTALGGGVAEVIRTTVAHHGAAGLASRWLVTHGTPAFFAITKHLHHLLHGKADHAATFADRDHQIYRAVTAAHGKRVLEYTRPGDIVTLHDPQTLGLAPMLRQHNRIVLWRCHIGARQASPETAEAWRFLAPYCTAVNHFVFSLPEYIPQHLHERPVTVMAPGLDPNTARCRSMLPDEVTLLLTAIGLVKPTQLSAAPVDTTGLVQAATVIQDEPLSPEAPVMLQLSRWDPLKGMGGLLDGFAESLAADTAADLVLAGPDPDEVADDAENQAVLAEVVRARSQLPTAIRRRVHLVVLRLTTRHSNQLLVNALLHQASLVIQNSREEGYGLIATEAMYHRKPIVATAVGGLAEQITDRQHGLLVPPDNRTALVTAVHALLADPAFAEQLAATGKHHCEQTLLINHEHKRTAALLHHVLDQYAAR